MVELAEMVVQFELVGPSGQVPETQVVPPAATAPFSEGEHLVLGGVEARCRRWEGLDWLAKWELVLVELPFVLPIADWESRTAIQPALCIAMNRLSSLRWRWWHLLSLNRKIFCNC